MTEPSRLRPGQDDTSTELREFMLVIRRALLLIVKWIERTYIV